MKIKKINLGPLSLENNRIWENEDGFAGSVEGRLEVLRQKVNQIIEKLNEKEYGKKKHS